MRTGWSTSQLAALLPLLAIAALVHSGARAQSAPAVGDSNSMGLRLADGSFIRVPCDKTRKAAANSCRCGTVESASVTAAPRRAPLKRRAQVFDSRTPGVVAGIRG